MVISATAVKHTAKNAMRGNYLKTILASMPMLLAVILCSYSISVVYFFTNGFVARILQFFVSAFLVFPLFCGTVRFFSRLIRDADDMPLDVFYCFGSGKLFFKAVLLQLMIVLRTALPVIAICLPAALVKVFSSGEIYEKIGMPIPQFVSSLEVVVYILTAVAAVLVAAVLFRYYMAVFLIASDESMTVSEAVYMSRVISRKSGGDFLGLLFSLVLYIIATLSLILAPFSLPLLFAAYCVHCRFAVSQYNVTVRRFNEETIPTFVEGE